MRNEDAGLDELFRKYRAACPDIEPSPQFMPSVWRRIEARQNFWLVFGRFGKMATTVSAALALLLLALNMFSSEGALLTAPSYADALMADHSAERTYYTEAIRPSAPSLPEPAH